MKGRVLAASSRGAARALLGIYPPEFRADVADEVLVDIRSGVLERAAATGRVAAVVWALRNLAALVTGVVPEWRDRVGRERRAARSPADWVREIRFAARALVRDRAFSLTVVITLTLGIAMTTAVFSVVDGVLLRPLAYPNADDVVLIWQHDRAQGIERDAVAVGNYLDWRDRTSLFDGMAALEPWGLEFLTDEGPEEVDAFRVTEDFFPVMGTPPLFGRTLAPEDYDLQTATAVVSHAFWQHRLGADPGVVGTTIRLDEAPVLVAGVMPPEFDFPRGNAIWIPRTFNEAEGQNRVANYYDVVARLAPGVDLALAQAELDRAATQMEQEYPATNESIGANAVPLPELVLGPVRSGLLLLLACSGLLLAIACTNVASLVIARTNDRLGLMGMRSAMGASRRDLVMPQVLECVILAVVSAVLSAGLVSWTIGALKSLAPATLPRVADVSVDARVWLFALAIAFAVSLLVGLPATLRASRVDLTELLKGSGRSSTGSKAARARRESLVAVQLAMALVLVTAATLTARSVLAISALDPGYRTDNIAVVTSQIWRQYPTGPAQAAFVEEARARLAALPGVREVGTTSSLPLAEQAFADEARYWIERDGSVVEGREASAGSATISPGYHEALGVPLIEGRRFDTSDGADAARVILVNEELARRHFPDRSPVGERITLSFAGPPVSAEVVGVVGDVRHGALDTDPGPRIYIPHQQSPNGALLFAARTSVEPETLIESMKEGLWDVNAALSMGASYAFRELRAGAERERQFYAILLVAFAVVALSIAAVGVYGLGAYTVARQRPEIGIMLAL
ncbi:MAG: ADOP family duplicated permease, partial [Gemmatimonadota bacterium]|nr:ADOP family duplicated permease [Gemmatimonadota bacterium]